MSNESAASIKAEEVITLRPRVTFSRVNHGNIYETLKEMSPREQARYIEQMLARVQLFEDLVHRQLTARGVVLTAPPNQAPPQQAKARFPWMDVPV